MNAAQKIVPERECLAAQLHELYRETARRRGWPIRKECDVEYGLLSEDAKALDLMFADWHLAKIAELEAKVRRLQKECMFYVHGSEERDAKIAMLDIEARQLLAEIEYMRTEFAAQNPKRLERRG